MVRLFMTVSDGNIIRTRNQFISQSPSLRLCHTGAKNRQRKIVTKFVIRCVCHTEGLKMWPIMKKMTHKNLKIFKQLVHVPDI